MKKIIISTLMTMGLTQVNALDVHEWGTFTSVVNKEGKMIQGLHHEEEPLPNFVYDLSRIERTGRFSSIDPIDPLPPFGGGGPITRGFAPASMDLMPIPTFTERITQKMETPVIYFYSDKEVSANIRVDFPDGVISQWFPKVSSINPSEEAKKGYAVWDVKVLAQKEAQLPATSGNSIWNPSREVNANIVKADSELEKLIFYRGLGDFDTALKVSQQGGAVVVQNKSPQDIHGLTLLNYRENVYELIHIKHLPSLAITKVTFDSRTVGYMKFNNFSTYLEKAKELIVKDLVASGLYKDESIAMVNTWEAGYFQTQGTRLLYVLPREWTDEILPMKVTPAPKNLVRTLVGRVEVLTEEDDATIKEFVETKVQNNLVNSLQVNGRIMEGLGHFPEPKLRRALELNISPALQLKVNGLIQAMNSGF